MGWIVQNRQVRDSAAAVGDCLPKYEAASEARQAIRQAIAAFVDDQFRSHCSLGVVDAGRVVILVDSAVAVDALRRAWLTALRSHLVDHCRAFRARRLEFRVGRGDDRFAEESGHGASVRDR
jgi:hypothetical protein